MFRVQSPSGGAVLAGTGRRRARRRVEERCHRGDRSPREVSEGEPCTERNVKRSRLLNLDAILGGMCERERGTNANAQWAKTNAKRERDQRVKQKEVHGREETKINQMQLYVSEQDGNSRKKGIKMPAAAGDVVCLLLPAR